MNARIFLIAVFILIIFLAGCSSNKESPTIRFPYERVETGAYGGNIDRQNFVEPSGICFHPLRKTLFIVSDNGELAEIRTDGTPVFNVKILGDLEGITVNPDSGLLYIVHEGEDIILEFDPEEKEVARRFPINREFQGNQNFLQKQSSGYDQGVESIAFVLDEEHPEGGRFYVGNQWDPPCIMEVHVPLKSSRSESAEARIVRVFPFKINDPSCMYYDPKKKLLNVASDMENILVELTLDGRLVNEYAFPGDYQEGLAKDDEGYLYIAQDSGGIVKLKDLR